MTRVTIESVNGRPFDASETYSIATSGYIAKGGDKYSVFAGSEYVDLGITQDLVLERYIVSGLDGKVGDEYAGPQGRITVIDSASSGENPAAATSPAGIFGILAGISAAGLLVLRRK